MVLPLSLMSDRFVRSLRPLIGRPRVNIAQGYCEARAIRPVRSFEDHVVASRVHLTVVRMARPPVLVWRRKSQEHACRGYKTVPVD